MSEVQHQAKASERSYLLLRKYAVFDTDSKYPEKPTTELLAKIDYAAGGLMSYKIEKSTGGMGEWAIRHALDHEVELNKSPERMEMTERNYTFSFLKMSDLRGRRCYVLESHPKHGDRELLQAQVWVDAQSFRILQIQGHPQKSPSFWVKRLDLTLEYGEMGGMWMHTGTRADAEVRFSGPFSVVADAVRVQMNPGLVQARGKAHPVRAAAEAMVGGAVISARAH